MKTAFLILAHHQPAHLADLVEYLSAEWTSIFIHIDNKVNISEFEKQVREQKDINFLQGKDRVKVHWGGFSLLRATLNLIEAAQNSGEKFNRYCLLSGSDFPIKNLSHIRNAFESGREYIRIDRLLEQPGHNVHSGFVNAYHFYDYPSQIKMLSGKLSRKIYNKIKLYHGSTWWSLTSGCVQYIMRYISENSDYYNYHRWVLHPDEIFFHSIIKQSPFDAAIVHNYKTDNPLNEHGCTYIDWDARNGPSPKILTVEDFDRIIGSQCLFARKFDQKMSSGLLNMIKKTIK